MGILIVERPKYSDLFEILTLRFLTVSIDLPAIIPVFWYIFVFPMRLTANINSQEKKTFLFHFSYSFIEGIITGVLVLNEFVFLKSMQGSPYQVALLFKFSMVVLLAAIFINEGLPQDQQQEENDPVYRSYYPSSSSCFVVFPSKYR
jgi:hypothetical protein